MHANPVLRVARLPRIRCFRSLDHCLITKEIKVIVVAKADGGNIHSHVFTYKLPLSCYLQVMILQHVFICGLQIIKELCSCLVKSIKVTLKLNKKSIIQKQKMTSNQTKVSYKNIEIHNPNICQEIIHLDFKNLVM